MEILGLILALAVIILGPVLLQIAHQKHEHRSLGHACRIPARLEIGSLPVIGEILLLEAGGCIFRATDDASYRMLQHYAESDVSRLRIAGLCVPLHVRWLRGGQAGCRFERALPRMFQHELLASSATPPKRMRARRRAPNIRKRYSPKARPAYRSQSLWPHALPSNVANLSVRRAKDAASCPRGLCETKPCRYCHRTG